MKRLNLLKQVHQGRKAGEVLIPIRTESLNERLRGHWSARARKAKNERSITLMKLNCEGPGKVLPATVTLIRISKPGATGWQRLDSDNLHGALKHVRDGVADYLGIDDGDQR